eukprot:CAMPEP_0174891060 /NCGR_PEP_ID=MMETSP0167-20121228/6164_1 /TAXON_ID=38298 /ORGANISM="Rhodella maculata, Strain CCMP736" /LENGTH=127 /DNA_ID=CAMNT_0016129077 /DNA_START=40 /DNA_END=423 /DNA_ORIENTATION=+
MTAQYPAAFLAPFTPHSAFAPSRATTAGVAPARRSPLSPLPCRLPSRPASSVVVAVFAPGDAVRVKKAIKMYHVGKTKGSPVDVKGMQGVVAKIIDTDVISATKPVVVKFAEPKFMAHFEEEELEKV